MQGFPGHSLQWENSMEGQLDGRINICDGVSLLYLVMCEHARRRHKAKHVRIPWTQRLVGGQGRMVDLVVRSSWS